MQRIPTLSETDMSLFEIKTRFVRNYLTFAGKNSKDFLLYISGPGVYNSPAVDMELQSVPGRNGDLIRDKVYTIEGNTSDMVARRSYALNNSRILGYGRPAYDEVTMPTKPTSTTRYYRVRTSWADKSSQIAACVVLQNAINIADLNKGFSVFDEDGKCVYGPAMETFTPYRVRVSISDLRIRTGPGTDYEWTGKYTGKGVFTAVAESAGKGSDKGWMKLKSGAGWCSLDYCEKL